MKIDNVKKPKSSFLSIEKDLEIILNEILKNERIKRLLYYTTKDALRKPNITEDQTLELVKKNIKIVPKLYVDNTVYNYLMISFTNFSLTPTNPEFRQNNIDFIIICHNDQWQLEDFALRPFKIAAELDSIFNHKRLTGLGQLEFVRATQEVISDEYVAVCVRYKAIHGEEDKKFMPNPKDEERFQQDYDDYYNA